MGQPGGLIFFDSDVLIDAGRGVEAAIQALKRAEAQGKLAVSAVAAMELIVGCRNRDELRALDSFLLQFSVVPVDVPASDRGLELLRTYRLSHGLLIADALIAATALGFGASLISKNQKHYRFIEGLDLLPYPNAFL